MLALPQGGHNAELVSHAHARGISARSRGALARTGQTATETGPVSHAVSLAEARPRTMHDQGKQGSRQASVGGLETMINGELARPKVKRWQRTHSCVDSSDLRRACNVPVHE